jgi:FAD/FMN-containing dehydrogenase
MGVDQILSAKVVDQSGSIVDAAPEMLEVIRGGTKLMDKAFPLSWTSANPFTLLFVGGGTLGVIVELSIKVYPLDKVPDPASSSH